MRLVLGGRSRVNCLVLSRELLMHARPRFRSMIWGYPHLAEPAVNLLHGLGPFPSLARPGRSPPFSSLLFHRRTRRGCPDARVALCHVVKGVWRHRPLPVWNCRGRHWPRRQRRRLQPVVSFQVFRDEAGPQLSPLFLEGARDALQVETRPRTRRERRGLFVVVFGRRVKMLRGRWEVT